MIDHQIMNLLAEPVRQYVCEMEWEDFRPIQKAAISGIMLNDRNYVLSSRTASGKTEAAFLPVLSKVCFDEPGIQVLYISPLIALINDQMERVLDLCRFMEVRVTKWHGEASGSAKRQLEKEPSGVMLTTPESLEAMFACHPERIMAFFGNLKYIIIDEIHYFIGTDRGLQLQSLLSRLQACCMNKIRFVGLSATIGDYAQAKNFMGNPDETTVLIDKTPKPIDMKFRFYEQVDAARLPMDLVKDIFKETYQQKALIFPNNRRSVEELAVRMKNAAEKIGIEPNYFAHHSSVDKRVCEEIEQTAKSNGQNPFTICCTSTLELGIDIGSVDMVGQVNSLYSIASMIQRAGRSGRKDGKEARMIVYSTDQMAMLQSLACWNLHQKGVIEKPSMVNRPYDVMVHQILSIVKEKSEIDVITLIDRIMSIHIFSRIEKRDIATIIKHLIKSEILEVVGNKLVIGVEGEYIVNGRDFYSMFTTPEVMQVMYGGRKIGEVQPSMIIAKGNNIYLAAHVWSIVDVDNRSRKVFVEPATDGRPPKFSSDDVTIPEVVEREMFRLLDDTSDDMALNNVMDEASINELMKMRSTYGHWRRENILINEGQGQTTLLPLCGTAIDMALYHFIKMEIPETKYHKGMISIPLGTNDFMQMMPKIEAGATMDRLEKHVTEIIENNPRMTSSFSKFGHLLPTLYQARIYIDKMLNPADGIREIQTLKKRGPAQAHA